jgi:SAM-dependent methyltransferase
MCNWYCRVFGRNQLSKEEVENKRILEVGSLNVNGTLRYDIVEKDPAEYIGIDINEGKDVDQICRVEDIVEVFGKDSFDVVVCTEMMEHIEDWRLAISNLKNVCKPGGIIILTTRSKGFPEHGFPDDFWRYEPDDMKVIFSDFEVKTIRTDKLCPGIFIKAVKPNNFVEKNLNRHTVYSMKE